MQSHLPAIGVGALYTNPAKFEFGGHRPLRAHPHQYGVGLRRWKNQRRLSSSI